MRVFVPLFLAIAFFTVSVTAQTPVVTVTGGKPAKPKKPGLPGFRGKKKLSTEEAKLKALEIPTGAPVALRTADNKKVKGTLEGMTADGMVVRTVQDGRTSTQTIAFDQVSGLKQKGKPKKGSAGQSAKALDASVAGIPEGTPVTVTLADKTKVTGRFAGQTPEGMAVKVPGQAGEGMTTRTFKAGEIAGVKQSTGKLPGMPSLQSPVMVKKSLSGIPVGSPVKLNMPGGALLSGKLMGLTADGFSLQTLEGGSLVTKQLRFDQVASVKRPSLGIRGMIPGLKPPGMQTPQMMKTKALAMPAGSPLTVTMPDGAKISGKLMGTTNEGLQLQNMQNGTLVNQTLSFDQIGSIKPGAPKTVSMRAKTVSRTVITMVVTAAVAGFISGKIAK
jgi:small nuclear ribonucleoprotein (snRNP)-like protein